MAKLSLIIPSRHELYLQQTVEDILVKATGEIEIIVVLDGYWPDPPLREDDRLITVHRDRRGMRAAINSAVAIAKGEYLMKVDAHCMFPLGFDEVLKADCDGDWVVIPRRYSLLLETWGIKQDRPLVDYEYLSYPYGDKKTVHGDSVGLHARVWKARGIEKVDKLVDENMTFQGSCWFTTREHFTKRIGFLQEEGYGTFIGEPQEIGLKTWLGGGKCVVNKKTFYAHLWKGKPYRAAFMEKYGTSYTRVGHSELVTGNAFSVDYWINNRWKDRIHDLSWLVERFWPVQSWPEDRTLWTH
jgi:glycosyltransferase involved in cell wall biosynthesis